MALFLFAAALLSADGPGVLTSYHSARDFALTADPSAPQWRNIKGVFAEDGPKGEPVPGHRTEIRSRWTDGSLYLLYICPYAVLHLRPDPSITSETNHLWDWDVAEAFIGSDFTNIKRYKEFEVSPQGEWVDLDIDRDRLGSDDNAWKWNSGFTSKTRIDRQHKVWYAEMKIPMQSIDSRKPEDGRQMRINLYRCQGPPANRKYIAWQPTGAETFHVPEAFGRLLLKK